MWVLWSSYSIFSEKNDLLTPVTPNDPGWSLNVITFIEGVKLIHMNKLRVNATYFVGLDIFLVVKMTFLTPVTPSWPLTHHCLCTSSGQGTGHFDQVWSKSDVRRYVKKTCCQKEGKKRLRYKTLPGYTGRVNINKYDISIEGYNSTIYRGWYLRLRSVFVKNWLGLPCLVHLLT